MADPPNRLARADRLVRENRVTIAVVFPVVGAMLLLASEAGALPAVLAFNPLLLLLGTLVMRLPLGVALAPLVGRRTALALVGLTGFAYGIEAIGVATGWPYGEFAYGVHLGPMVEGVPLGLPVFFLPLVLNSYLLSVLVLDGRGGRAARLSLALALVLVVDLVLDPAAVALGFWTYADPGAYYGVPASNFVGWLLSGTVGVLLVEVAFGGSALRTRLADCEFALDDMVSFVLLWTVVNVAAGQWLAVAAVLVPFAGLVSTDRFDLAGGGAVDSLGVPADEEADESQPGR